MSLVIPDDVLSGTGLGERDASIEIACRLFAAGKLTFPAATRWTSLTRTEFETELLARDLPLVLIDETYLRQELQSLERLETP